MVARDTSRLFEAANRVLSGHLEVFGQAVPLRDGVPDWNADPVTGKRVDLSFGPFINFRHLSGGVDIKFLWEVNRHLWWVSLAQCYALCHEKPYLDRLRALLASWLIACPYPLGANWSSPVEHGIRLINWSAVWHLIGGATSPMFDGKEGRQLRQRWLDSIYRHVRFVSQHYSLYSSANNHLVGEAAGVFVAAHTWDRWLPVRKLRGEAKSILEREAFRQFSDDGVNLEQAMGYHKFCLQFLIASSLTGRANGDDFSGEYWARIEAAFTFLAAMMDSAGQMPGYGDSDDGEVWRFSEGTGSDSFKSMLAIGAALFGRSDLQAKLISVGGADDPQMPWLVLTPPPTADTAAMRQLPTHFQRGGYVILGEHLHEPNELRVTFDCGPLGLNRIAGHGHADALSVLVGWGGEALLVDSGTYCYNTAPHYRHYFRATRAHNTLVVDGLDQSDYGGSFLWLRDVNCTVVQDIDAPAQSVHAIHDGYARLPDPVIHHRRVSLTGGGDVLVEDWIECSCSHDVELLWHAAPRARFVKQAAGASRWVLKGNQHSLRLDVDPASRVAVVEGQELPPQGWVSSRFYERVPAQVLSISATLAPGQVIRTTISRCPT